MSGAEQRDLKALTEKNPFPKLKKEVDSIISKSGMSYISGTNKILYNCKRMDYYCMVKFILKEPNQLDILKSLYENIYDENKLSSIIDERIYNRTFAYKRTNHMCKTLFQELLYRLITTFYEQDKETYDEHFIYHLLHRLKMLDNEKYNFTINIDKTVEKYKNEEYHIQMNNLQVIKSKPLQVINNETLNEDELIKDKLVEDLDDETRQFVRDRIIIQH